MTPGACGQFGPQGLDWQGLCRRPLNIATYYIQYISSGPRCFREVFFLIFAIISLWEFTSPGSRPVWTPGPRLAGFM